MSSPVETFAEPVCAAAPAESRRPASNLALPCLASACWAFGFGLEFPLSSLWMQAAGRGESFIGLNAGVHFLGLIAGGFAAPALMRRWGRTCVAVGLLGSGVGVAVFPWGGPALGWFLLRGLAGAAGALAVVPLESLINHSASEERRARDFGFYAVAVALGIALGSFAGLNLYPLAPELAFVLGGALTLLGLAVLPLLPRFPEFEPEPDGPAGRSRRPFLSFGSAWTQGFLEAGMMALLPIYLRSVGLLEGGIGVLMGVILLAVIAAQLPVAWLADRLGRERVLVGCFAVAAAGLAAVPFCDKGLTLAALLCVVGACSGALYPLGLALLGERLPPSEVPAANAWYLGVNCFGSLVSPVAAGALMEALGGPAMFWTGAAVALGVLVIWKVMR